MHRYISLAIAALVLSLAASALAQDKEDFPTWLRHYGAYDVLSRELADKPTDPAQVLEKGEALLMADDPAQARALLESTPPFADPAQEQQRLVFLARAFRQLGMLPEAVFSYSQAAAGLSDEQVAALLDSQPDLSWIFKDVWRQWFWTRMAENDQTRLERLSSLLSVTLHQARIAWPAEPFWQAATRALEPGLAYGPGLEVEAEMAPLPAPTVSPGVMDRLTIAKAMAAAALDDWDQAARLVSGLSDPYQAAFWSGILTLAREQDLPESGPGDPRELLAAAGLVKPASFFAGYWSSLWPLPRENWVVADPEVPSWPAFKAGLLQMPPANARDAIRKELESVLISPATVESLSTMDLAFALMDGDAYAAQDMARQTDLRSLPISLKISLMALTGTEPVDLAAAPQSDDPEVGSREHALLNVVSGALDMEHLPGVMAPFWISEDEPGLLAAIQSRPLDPLLTYGWFRAAWAKERTPVTAKRLAFLFPNSPQGASALLYLAEEAGKTGAYQASAYYLNKVDPSSLGSATLADYLQSRGALEIELGRDKQALATYMKLMELDSERLPPLKRLKLALMAQQLGNLEWAQTVLQELWDKRGDLTPGEQAEVLFWMAEGNQSMGQMEQALDRYLKVAWQYPEQNIWAVTAMYRASLIYEQRGSFDTAKRLLKTVIKNSDRKSQVEAAEARLSAIDKKTKKDKETPNWQYPF